MNKEGLTIKIVKLSLLFLLILCIGISSCTEQTPYLQSAQTFTSSLTKTPIQPAVTQSPTITQIPTTTRIAPTLTSTNIPTLPPNLITSLAEQAITIKSSEPGQGCDDLTPLMAMIGEASVVALGEATHGTREFFQIRHRIIECLIREKGFNHLVVEANWAESRMVNDAIHTADSDLASALRGLIFWHLNTESFLNLLNWLRDYNINHANTVQFQGFDMQFPSGILDVIEDYLTKVDPASVRAARTYTDCFTTHVINPAINPSMKPYSGQSEVIQAECYDGLHSLSKLFEENQASYQNNSSQDEYTQILQAVRMLQQAERLFAESDIQASINLRDQYMAENILGMLKQAGEDAKILIWAHNGHIQKAPSPVPQDIDTAISTFIPMGKHLNTALGDKMVVIGLGFAYGQFNAYQVNTQINLSSGLKVITAKPPFKDSFEEVFRQLTPEITFFDLKNILQSPDAFPWFEQPHWMREIGAGYDPDRVELTSSWGRLQDWYDGFIFFLHTHPTHLLP